MLLLEEKLFSIYVLQCPYWSRWLLSRTIYTNCLHVLQLQSGHLLCMCPSCFATTDLLILPPPRFSPPVGFYAGAREATFTRTISGLQIGSSPLRWLHNWIAWVIAKTRRKACAIWYVFVRCCLTGWSGLSKSCFTRALRLWGVFRGTCNIQLFSHYISETGFTFHLRDMSRWDTFPVETIIIASALFSFLLAPSVAFLRICISFTVCNFWLHFCLPNFDISYRTTPYTTYMWLANQKSASNVSRGPSPSLYETLFITFLF